MSKSNEPPAERIDDNTDVDGSGGREDPRDQAEQAPPDQSASNQAAVTADSKPSPSTSPSDLLSLGGASKTYDSRVAIGLGDSQSSSMRGAAFGHTRSSGLKRLAIPLWIIASIGLLSVISSAASLIIPIVLAFFAFLVLRPLVCRLVSWNVPTYIASVVVVVGVLLVLLTFAAMVVVPAQYWLQTAPDGIAKLQTELEKVRKPFTVIEDAEETLDPVDGVVKPKITVDVQEPQMIDQGSVINQTGQVIAYGFVVVVTTLFLLIGGDELISRVLSVLPTPKDRQALIETIVSIQDTVGRYLGQITMINMGLGIAVSLVTWMLGMPTPILWGTLTAFCNFIPYVGPIMATGFVILAATTHFESIQRGCFIGLAVWLTTAVEGQFMTPAILGRTMKVGPVLVLLAVAFWGYIWGLAGIFLAIPMLMTVRIICSRFVLTKPIAIVLGDVGETKVDPDRARLPEDQPLAEVG